MPRTPWADFDPENLCQFVKFVSRLSAFAFKNVPTVSCIWRISWFKPFFAPFAFNVWQKIRVYSCPFVVAPASDKIITGKDPNVSASCSV